MYKVGVIGDQDSVLGFMALGIDIFPAHDSEEIKNTINKLAGENYAIIYITEEASLLAKDTIKKYKDRSLPAIIVISGSQGSQGLGMAEIRESAKRAIGADILFNE
jgi:V/A-type H+-transporting ATPase subunit F